MNNLFYKLFNDNLYAMQIKVKNWQGNLNMGKNLPRFLPENRI